MCSERFNTEYFGRVMSAEEEIHAEFFGGNGSPVRLTSGKRGFTSGPGSYMYLPCDVPHGFRAA